MLALSVRLHLTLGHVVEQDVRVDPVTLGRVVRPLHRRDHLDATALVQRFDFTLKHGSGRGATIHPVGVFNTRARTDCATWVLATFTNSESTVDRVTYHADLLMYAGLVLRLVDYFSGITILAVHSTCEFSRRLGGFNVVLVLDGRAILNPNALSRFCVTETVFAACCRLVHFPKVRPHHRGDAPSLAFAKMLFDQLVVGFKRVSVELGVCLVLHLHRTLEVTLLAHALGLGVSTLYALDARLFGLLAPSHVSVGQLTKNAG